MDYDGDQPKAKKSLINSFENLQSKVSQLAEVKQLSNKMIRKFQRIDDEPVNKESEEPKGISSSIPDIIDLFNDLAEDLQTQINAIGANIERMLDWIE